MKKIYDNVERMEVPPTYKALQHFNISREQAEDCVANDVDDYHRSIYEPWVLDALYCGDIEQMNRALAAPNTYIVGSNVYCFDEISDMSPEELTAIGLVGDTLTAYIDRVEAFAKERNLTHKDKDFVHLREVAASMAADSASDSTDA